MLKIAQPYLSDEHFTVDGTLIEAWASQKSFRPKDEEPGPGRGNGEVNFRRRAARNDTHQSTTDPEARLYPKSKGAEARLSYLGHGLMDNRHGLLVRTMVTTADGTAERDAALLMVAQIPGGEAGDVGGRQELRHAAVCARVAADERHPACGPEQHQPIECH